MGKASNIFALNLGPMPDSDIQKKIREMLLEMGDEQLLAEFDGAVKAFEEHDRMISDTIDELSKEVDDLLLRMDALEAEEESSEDGLSGNESNESC